MLTRLILAARAAGLDFTADELAEICWVAARLDPDAESSQPFAAPMKSPAAELPAMPVPPLDTAAQPPFSAASAARSQGSRVGALRPHASAVGAGVDGVAIRIAAAPTLPRAELARALRPLKRRNISRTDVEWDQEETIARAADSDGGFLLPAFRPKPDRWLDLVVVADDAGSGSVWRSNIQDFLRVLQESGAFRGIRVYRIDSDEPGDKPLMVRGETSAAKGNRDPRELVDPTGSRAVLVLSDCVSAGWGDGRVARLLNLWVAAGPVAVVQLLPQRLWRRCPTRFVPIEWRASRPTTTNTTIDWRFRDHEPGEPPPHLAGTPIPVTEMTGRGLAQWARLVAGQLPQWAPGVALFAASPATYALRGYARAVVSDTDDPEVRVARFRAVASPQAYQLATYLGAAPLQLPVIRLVQQAMFDSPRPAHIAELLLSGLLGQTSPDDRRIDPDKVEYDFQPGIRQVLLGALNRRETLDVLFEVGRYLNQRTGAGIDLLALLSPADGLGDGVGSNRAFALVALEVLRTLGGAYAEKAGYLESIIVTKPDKKDRVSVRGRSEDAAAPVGPDGDLDSAASTSPRKDDAVKGPGLRTTPTLERPRDASRVDVWEVPRRTPHFTGRKQLLSLLRAELLNSPKAAVLVPRALYGLGGVGKTALANEYAWAFDYAYDVVWWIPAEDPADVRRSLATLGDRLKLPETADVDQAVRNVLEALASGNPRKRWLLIFDNANDPAALRTYLPSPTSYGHVLVTSRDERWANEGRPLEVDAFTRAESISLLRRRAPQLTDTDADRLADLVNDLPLAVNQAAAWHAETGLSVDEYFGRYHEKLSLLAGVPLPLGYPETVAATFGVSYDQLSGRSLAAAQLLQLCSHFGPEPISVDMLWRGRYVEGLPSPLGRTVLDRAGIKRQLREIDRYELVRLDQARDRFQLHRLVQVVLRTALAPEQRYTTPEQAQRVLALANPGNPDDLDIRERVRHAELSPHILPSGALLAQDQEVRTLVLDQIRYRYLGGDYVSGRELASEVVDKWLERFGPRDERTLVARRHYANIVRALGEPQQSLIMDREVLGLFEETLGKDSEHSLATANSLGGDLRAVGLFQEAHDLDEANLERHRKNLRDDDPATLRSANNYAVDLRLLGAFDRAEELDREIVELRTAGYGTEHPLTLFAMSNLVRDIYDLGRYGEALTMQQDILATYEAVQGANHPDVMLARRTVAVLLRKLGRYAPARKLAEENYESYRTRFGRHHEHTLSAMMSLSNAILEENASRETLAQAQTLANEALVLYGRHFPAHPFVDVCSTNYAIVLRHVGQVGQARELNTTALERLRERLGERHPYTLCCAVNLSNDMAAGRDYEAAYELSRRTLEVSRDVRGELHPYTLACSSNHAINAQVTDREDDGLSSAATIVRQLATALGADHPDTMAAREGKRIDADIEPPPT